MKKLISIIVLSLLLGGCVTKQTRNVQINNLQIKEISDTISCKNGTLYTLFLHGPISEDSTVAVEKILSEQSKCFNKDGDIIIPHVYLNSNGGYLNDGFKLGEIFSKYKVSTRINNNQVCMSACATAFLGGYPRYMFNGSRLMVHAPYKYNSNQTIECTSKKAAIELKNYYISKIGNKGGEFLFDRTMKYCGNSEGWFLNKDAALLFNITQKYNLWESPDTVNP